MTVFAFFEELIASNKAGKRMATVRNYQNTLNSFSAFLEHKDIAFADMNEGMIKGYERWLRSNGVTLNSISYYIRNLRAVYNQAVL